MKHTTFSILCLIHLFSCAASAASPPNVIVILTDDQLHDAIAYYEQM